MPEVEKRMRALGGSGENVGARKSSRWDDC